MTYVDFIYEVRQCGYPRPPYALDHTVSDRSYYRAEVFLRRGSQSYDVHGYEEQDLIADVLDQFEKYLHLCIYHRITYRGIPCRPERSTLFLFMTV